MTEQQVAPEAATVEVTTPKTPEPTVEKDWQAEAEKWKGLARKHETQAKSNADKAQQYDALAEASKSEQEKAVEAAKAEGRSEGEARALRLEVALEKKLPKTLAIRLQGSTREELEADADELLKLAPGTNGSAPAADLGQGQRTPMTVSGAAAGKAEAAKRFGDKSK